MRLSEFDSLIEDILDYHSDQTVHELKVMKRNMDLVDFGLTTLVNLHMLTCAMIMLSQTKENFEDSWLGGTGAEREDSVACYVTSLYFVTTTLSTCGFGDICPSSGDSFESFYVFILQFVGMFFYSSTIDRIQGYLDVEEIAPGDYANYMVEELESQIVKIGKILTETNFNDKFKVNIPGSMIKEYQIATLKCF